MTSKFPLLLFAKAPIAGRVKTRLQSHCSAEQAAKIAEVLMEQSIQKAIQYWSGPVYLSVWLDQAHPFLQTMASRYSVSITRQCEGDLGAKMNHALKQYGYPAAVMGCDVPHISSEVLEQAQQVLSDGRSVIGPSEDGGYYVLGLTEPAAHLFRGVNWGTSRVFEQTLERASLRQHDLYHLPTLIDIDEWTDLQAVRKTLPSLDSYLKSQGFE